MPSKPTSANLPSFPDVVAGLHRAKEHFDQYLEETDRFGNLDSYRIVVEPNLHSPVQTVSIALAEYVPQRHWANLISDCLHQTRRALDHVVYLASCWHQNAPVPTNWGSSSFPLRGNVSHLRGHVGDEVLGIIERHQPDHGPEPAPGFRPFAELDTLQNRDKHRMINFHVPELQDIDVFCRSDAAYLWIEKHTPAPLSHKSPTKVATVGFDRPVPPVEVKPNMLVLVALDEGYSERSANFVVWEIYREARRTIVEITKEIDTDVAEWLFPGFHDPPDAEPELP